MRIVALSGSLRANSANGALIRAAVALAPARMEFTIYDRLADLPHFNPDLDGDDPPAPVTQLRGVLRKADGVLISTPEYAFGVPGALKNALDWIVSSGELAGKPVAVISASPSIMGGDKAHASLLLTLRAEAATIVDGGTLIVSAVKKKLDEHGNVSDLATLQALGAVLEALARTVTM